MSTDRYIEQLENSDLPTETIEAASDSLGFVQGFHDLLVDLGVRSSSSDIDVNELEKAFEGFVAEISAASIFLASFTGAEKHLANAVKGLEAEEDAPELILHGYKKLLRE